MAEIIRPEFKRAVKQKLRMLKARPELSRLPEFKTKSDDGVIAFAFILAAAILLRRK